LLDFLCCPQCKQELSVRTIQEAGQEIIQGELTCSNGHAYPVLNSIPRFVGSESYTESFGFQWNKFARVQIDCFNDTTESRDTFLEKTGFDLDRLKQKLVLDAGTGAGRFADVVSRAGGEVIGVDLSSAVDAAYNNIGERPNVHFIQADLFDLPLKENIFDAIFSIGVLHHTPSTQDAFHKLVPLLKQEGEIAIWVYARYSELKKITDSFRRVTTRLPRVLVFYASTIAVPLYYLKPLRTVFQGVFRLCMHPNWKWRWLDTFDYFAPKYQWKHTYPELFSWFQQEGLADVVPLSAPVSMKGKRA
jgi:SAM-dependent methyltransferase